MKNEIHNDIVINTKPFCQNFFLATVDTKLLGVSFSTEIPTRRNTSLRASQPTR